MRGLAEVGRVYIDKSTPSGRITAPPYKSHAIRVLFVSMASRTPITIENIPKSRDFDAAVRAVRCLGAEVHVGNGDRAVVYPPERIDPVCRAIDAGGSATVFKFASALASQAPEGRDVVVDGDPTLRRRPIDELVYSLRMLGSRVEFLVRDPYPPIRVYGGGWRRKEIKASASKSSQHISALMIAGLLSSGGVDISISGGVVSRGFIWLTGWVIRSFGWIADLSNDLSRIRVYRDSDTPRKRSFRVMGDYTLAAYPIVASYVTSGSISVCGLDPPLSFTGDWSLFRYIEQLGSKVSYDPDSLCFNGFLDSVVGGEVDLADSPDLAPPLSVIGVFSERGVSISGVSHLRYKESNRLDSIVSVLRSFGVEASHDGSRILVHPSKVRAGSIYCPNDHRIAMMASILALVDGGAIENYRCVEKSWPGYWSVLESIGVRIRYS